MQSYFTVIPHTVTRRILNKVKVTQNACARIWKCRWNVCTFVLTKKEENIRIKINKNRWWCRMYKSIISEIEQAQKRNVRRRNFSWVDVFKIEIEECGSSVSVHAKHQQTHTHHMRLAFDVIHYFIANAKIVNSYTFCTIFYFYIEIFQAQRVLVCCAVCVCLQSIECRVQSRHTRDGFSSIF